MKALVLKEIGNLNIENIKKPLVKENEVLVKVVNCGICGSDIVRAYKDGAHNMPLIIGHEFAGIVDDVGINVDKSWKNKRVGVFPLIPCMECECCKIRKYEMCENYSYLGSRQNGGFAEYVAVPEWNIIELPEKVTLEQAAMLEPMAVAVHAIRQVLRTKGCDLKNGKIISFEGKKNEELLDKEVVVMGLGTIGLLVTMFLMDLGFHNVYTIGNKDIQKAFIKKIGIDERNYCDSKTCDVNKWIIENTKGNGADLFFECVGRMESLNTGINVAAPEGIVCILGNPVENMEINRDIYWKILRNQLTLVGTWNSSFTHSKDDDWNYAISILQQEKFQPQILITHRYSLDNIVKGYEIMRDKSEEYVKIMCEY